MDACGGGCKSGGQKTESKAGEQFRLEKISEGGGKGGWVEGIEWCVWCTAAVSLLAIAELQARSLWQLGKSLVLCQPCMPIVNDAEL